MWSKYTLCINGECLGMKAWLAFVLFLLVYPRVYASNNRKSDKLKCTIKRAASHSDAKTNQVRNNVGTVQDASNSIKRPLVLANNKKERHFFNTRLKTSTERKVDSKLRLGSKRGSINLFSRKRQNVFTSNPSQQRLFHVDETGTLHRHEVGPEEYTTPDGKTETFSNDKLMTGENFMNLQPSPSPAVDPSTTQMRNSPFAPNNIVQASGSLPQVRPGSPVAFLDSSSPPPSTPPKRYYLMTYRRPSDGGSPVPVTHLLIIKSQCV